MGRALPPGRLLPRFFVVAPAAGGGLFVDGLLGAGLAAGEVAQDGPAGDERGVDGAPQQLRRADGEHTPGGACVSYDLMAFDPDSAPLDRKARGCNANS